MKGINDKELWKMINDEMRWMNDEDCLMMMKDKWWKVMNNDEYEDSWGIMMNRWCWLMIDDCDDYGGDGDKEDCTCNYKHEWSEVLQANLCHI